MLKWDETDLIAFFGTIPVVGEDGLYHAFVTQGHGLQLEVTIFAYEEAVYISLTRDGLPKPLFTVRREPCTHLRVIDKTNYRCLELGSPQHQVTDMGISPLLVRGIRIFIEPQFQIELIEPS